MASCSPKDGAAARSRANFAARKTGLGATVRARPCLCRRLRTRCSIAWAHWKNSFTTKPTIRPGRLNDKDALDLYRLMTTHRSDAVAKTMTELLLADERSRQVTVEGLTYLDQCFRSPASTGTIMAIRALEGNVPAARVAAVMNPYARALAQLLETIPETADDTRT